MDPEVKKKMEEISALVEENNKILHSMRNSMRMGRIMSMIYWIFIIGSAVGAYWLIQPYVDSFKGAYDNANSIIEGFSN